jgi:hypothetical protein
MADQQIHPGSFVGDTIEEWKKLPTWGKFAVGGVAVVVIFLAIRARQQGATTTTNATGPVSGSSLPPTSNTSSQGSSSAFPGVQSGSSSVPFLPSGINPVYDNSGGLVAFQQQPPTSASPPPSPASPPAQNPLAYTGLVGPNASINFQNRTYKNSSGQNVPLPLNANDQLVQGSQGRVWYTNGGGQHLLTSGQGPAINPTSNTPFTGGGGESFPSYARHLQSYTVRYGDNLASVATQLNIPGGLPAWLEHNNYPQEFSHGMILKIPGRS